MESEAPEPEVTAQGSTSMCIALVKAIVLPLAAVYGAT